MDRGIFGTLVIVSIQLVEEDLVVVYWPEVVIFRWFGLIFGPVGIVIDGQRLFLGGR